MCDRLTTIKKYYINLDYSQINKTDAEAKISTLIQQITFKNFSTLSQKFHEVASIIKKNLSLFASICKHVDMVTTIIQYFIHISERKEIDYYKNGTHDDDKIRIMTFLTLYNICPETTIRSFLRDTLITKDLSAFKYLKGQTNEIILLEDSDLDAVVNCLRIIENCTLTKIWIQEQIKEKFLWFKMKYLRDFNFPIQTFRSKQELSTSNIYNGMSIVSIWSENIVAAKKLAKSLNKIILFINTHMDFYDGFVFMPYIQTVHTASEILDSFDTFVSKSSGNEIEMTHTSKMISTSIYNLFYDGKWQKSTKTTYYKYDNSLWANATKDDVQKCVDSAQKGFEIWSNKSFEFRGDILMKLTDILISTGYYKIGCNLYDKLPLYCIKRSTYQTCWYKNKRLEATLQYVPLGIVILKERDESILFDRLLENLIVGNSVIVLHNANFYNFAPHCDILTTCGIPPGVINMLSHEDIEHLELYLCKSDYSTYAKNLDDFAQFPIQFKQIILPLK